MKKSIKFKTAKDRVHFVTIWGPAVFLIGMKFLGWSLTSNTFDYFLIAIFSLMASFTWFGTYYVFSDNSLILRSSWRKIEILPENIFKVESDSDLLGEMGSGIGLGRSGLRLYLTKSVKMGLVKRKDIKISPSETELFIAELKRRNDRIKMPDYI